MSALNLEADEFFYSFRVMRDTDHLTTPLLTYYMVHVMYIVTYLRKHRYKVHSRFFFSFDER